MTDAMTWFLKLEALLATHQVPCKDGSLRTASADEFIFMYTTYNSRDSYSLAGFKHRDTRNYIYVCWDETKTWIDIPKTCAPGHGGYFDWQDLSELGWSEVTA